MVIAAQDTEIKPGYKLTEVGVIPEDWKMEKLGDCLLSTPQYGVNTPAVPYTDTLPIYIRITDITDDGYFSPEKLASVKHISADKYVLKSGDLVFARTGASVGKTYLYRSEDGILVFAGYLIRVQVNRSKLLSDYLAAYVKTKHYWSWVRMMSMRSGQPGINGNEYAQLPLPLPSLKEQHAIATALSDVDKLISSLDKLIAKKRDIKQATMQQLLTGETRLPGFSGKWEVKSLGDIIETILGGGTPSRSNPEYWEGNIPWVTVKDFATFNPRSTQESITEPGLHNSASNLIRKGTIITSTRMAIGKAVIYEIDVTINQDLKAIFLKKDMNTLFVFYWFELHAKNIEQLGSGSTVKGISLPELKNIRFLKPPTTAEQQAIATILLDMDAEIVALERKRDKTRALKQGMMQELLTGKTRLV